MTAFAKAAKIKASFASPNKGETPDFSDNYWTGDTTQRVGPYLIAAIVSFTIGALAVSSGSLANRQNALSFANATDRTTATLPSGRSLTIFP